MLLETMRGGRDRGRSISIRGAGGRGKWAPIGGGRGRGNSTEVLHGSKKRGRGVRGRVGSTQKEGPLDEICQIRRANDIDSPEVSFISITCYSRSAN